MSLPKNQPMAVQASLVRSGPTFTPRPTYPAVLWSTPTATATATPKPTATPTSIPTLVPTATATPSPMPTATAIPQPTSTPSPIPVSQAPAVVAKVARMAPATDRDPAVYNGVQLTEIGGEIAHWHITRVELVQESVCAGLNVVNPTTGKRFVGFPVLVTWESGESLSVLEAKPEDEPSGTCASLTAGGAYTFKPSNGQPADAVSGLTLGNGGGTRLHIAYRLYWVWYNP
jgi:hypothetical protein